MASGDDGRDDRGEGREVALGHAHRGGCEWKESYREDLLRHAVGLEYDLESKRLLSRRLVHRGNERCHDNALHQAACASEGESAALYSFRLRSP
jgi:hypothetical protein